MVKALYNETKEDEVLGTPMASDLPIDSPSTTTSSQLLISPTIVGKYLTIESNGDVIIGDYSGGQGIFWDQSAGTLNILGGLTVDHLDIPDLVTANSFHVDIEGNMWLGATTLAGAAAYITKAGVAHFSSISLDTDVVLTGLQAGTQLAVQFLTAGSITSKAITLAVAGGTGDSYIASGKTDFTRVESGFILGVDDSDADKPKFYIGDASNYLDWDGTDLTVSASKVIRPFTAGMPITAGQAVFIYTDGKVYSTDARYANMTNTFIGVCMTTTATAGTAPIQTTGVITGLSGLTVASVYYLKNATETKDQSQETTNGDVQLATGTSTWQSFTTAAGVKQVSMISIYCFIDISNTLTLNLRSGQGTGGAVVATMNIVTGASATKWFEFLFPMPIEVSESTQYTIEIIPLANRTDQYWYDKSANPYASGRSSRGADYDFEFRTYYTSARGAIDTAAGTVSKKVGLATSATTLTLKDAI